MKIFLISERWERDSDEGMLVYLDRLAEYLHRKHELLIVHERGDVPSGLPSARVRLGKKLATPALKRLIDERQPELVLYCPTACATVNALVRHRFLQSAASGSACAMLSLQRRDYAPWIRPFLRMLRPWRLVVLSQSAARRYEELGFDVIAAPAGVDLERFRPAAADERMELRAKLGLPLDAKLILHVGHLARFRGIELLTETAQSSAHHFVVVASTANPIDAELHRRLGQAGATIRHEFIPNIEDYYRAADAYVFPVRNSSGSIEFPLSVLEAMASDLPVLTTPFGALPESFPGGEGLRYLRDDEALGPCIDEILGIQPRTRAQVESLGWDAICADLLDRLGRDLSN